MEKKKRNFTQILSFWGFSFFFLLPLWHMLLPDSCFTWQQWASPCWRYPNPSSSILHSSSFTFNLFWLQTCEHGQFCLLTTWPSQWFCYQELNPRFLRWWMGISLLSNPCTLKKFPLTNYYCTMKQTTTRRPTLLLKTGQSPCLHEDGLSLPSSLHFNHTKKSIQTYILLLGGGDCMPSTKRSM